MRKASMGAIWCLSMALTVACSQSDAGITTAVKTKLAADSEVQAHEINVDTIRGVVTLTGTVDDAAARDQALRLARETEGVVDVVDQLMIEPEDTASTFDERVEGTTGRATGALDDAALTASIKSKLLADSSVPGLQVDVDTNDGIVTLSGKVSNNTERDRAATIARDTEGVRQVENRLTVGQ